MDYVQIKKANRKLWFIKRSVVSSLFLLFIIVCGIFFMIPNLHYKQHYLTLFSLVLEYCHLLTCDEYFEISFVSTPINSNWDLWFSGWHVNNYLPDGTHNAMTLLLVNCITVHL